MASTGRTRVPLLLVLPIAVAAVVTPLVLSGGRASAQPPSQPPGADVKAIYLADCAICHAADGHGTNRGPTLVGVGRASLDYYLTTGRMPITDPAVQLGNPNQKVKRRKPFYSPTVIRGLEDYVQGLTGAGGPDIPSILPVGDVAGGGELFRLQCAACHAWAGDGGALLHREAPSLHHDTGTQIGDAVRAGPGLMPAFGQAALTDNQLNNLVAYVRYLDHPDDRGGEPLWHLGPMAEGGVAVICGLGLMLLTIRWIGDKE